MVLRNCPCSPTIAGEERERSRDRDPHGGVGQEGFLAEATSEAHDNQ